MMAESANFVIPDDFRNLPYPLPPAADGVDPWHDAHRKYPLLSEIAAIVDPHDAVVDLGTWRGMSLISLAAGAPNASLLIGVDNEARELDSQRMAARNLSAFRRQAGRPYGWPARFYHDAIEVPDGLRIGLAHVDGAHDYSSVLHDLLWCKEHNVKLILVDDVASLVEVRHAVEVHCRLYQRDWLEVETSRGLGVIEGEGQNALLRFVASQLGLRWPQEWYYHESY
jgi:hypothetical protein